MPRVLLTGLSGVGKSTLVAALTGLGHAAVDLDLPDWSRFVPVPPDPDDPVGPVRPGEDWLWREDRVAALLARHAAALLFVAGCAPNMARFRPMLDRVILLTAPPAVIRQRLRDRTGNEYGRAPEEAARVLALIDSVEPRLRRFADHVIDTSAPKDAVLAEVLRLADLAALSPGGTAPPPGAGHGCS